MISYLSAPFSGLLLGQPQQTRSRHMKNRKNDKRPPRQIANEFFEYLGKHLPQQCASDEFYFLPRSETAIKNLTRLDNLTPEKIQTHIEYVRKLLLEIPPEKSENLEDEIDRLFLKQSMESFVREFEDMEIWRNDPTLYIKIPLFATDQLISGLELNPKQIEVELYDLLNQIPAFLRVAGENLQGLSEISCQVGLDMISDAIQFYNHEIRAFCEEKTNRSEALISETQKVLNAWELYRNRLLHLPLRKHFGVGRDSLKEIIAVSLAYTKSPEEILEIAQSSYQETKGKICALARKIDSHKTWQEIIYERPPRVTLPSALVKLYAREVIDLRAFLYSHDIMTFPGKEKVIILETPSYLHSLRATASYRAPLTGQTKGHGIFYITPGKEDLELISSHCPYLSAHETYPGHHILDHLRIHHPNPIRRQIESPLFYEGWACYAEQLLDELGYIKDPRKQLIQLKRQLWRTLRATLDVKLQTNGMTLARAAEEIQALGFSSERAQRQVRRFCLRPGYQLCYFVGAYEINRLRKKFFSRMGLKRFHDLLLDGGEIPFHLVERRLETLSWDGGRAHNNKGRMSSFAVS